MFGMGTGVAPPTLPPEIHEYEGRVNFGAPAWRFSVPLLALTAVRSSRLKQAARAISTGQLHALTALPLPAYRRRSLRRLFRGVVPREVSS